MLRSTPLVSIITPTYNAQRFLADTCQSVDKQTFKDFEWIIVDDGSTDTTREFLSKLASERSYIKLIYLEINSGPIFARNEGIRRATGRFLAFLDADDLWNAEKLKVQVAFMLNNNIAFSFHDYRHMTMDGTKVGAVICGPEIVDYARHHTHRDIGCLTVMLEREKCNFKGFSEKNTKSEDFITWANIFKSGIVASRVPHDLGRYRLVSKSRSANKFSKIKDVFEVYIKHERINFPLALVWWICFLVNAQKKHLIARPKIDRSLVDMI